MKLRTDQTVAARSKRSVAFLRLQNMVVLLGAVTLAGCKKSEAPTAAAAEVQPVVQGEEVVFATNAPQLSAVEAQVTTPRVVAVTHATGRLYWNDDTTVRIFTPVFGKVTKILADVGDPVTVGKPLAELDSPDYAQALANARTAVGNLMAADKALVRTKTLLGVGAYARKDVEAAEATYIAALSERDRARAVLVNYGGGEKIFSELERAERDDRTEADSKNYGGTEDKSNSLYVVQSPLNGILVDKSINPGQEIRPDFQLAGLQPFANPLFIVSDPTTLWLQVDVAESDLPALEVGLKLRITSRSYPDKVFNGVISKIQETMDPMTRTVKVRGVVQNPDKLLKAEMYVVVDVDQDVSKIPQAGVNIPAKALFMKSGDAYVFIEESPGHYRRQKIKPGVEKDDIVPVYEGLHAGDKVVTEGALLLQAVLEPVGGG